MNPTNWKTNLNLHNEPGYLHANENLLPARQRTSYLHDNEPGYLHDD
jgi:hypothetical protein